MANRELLDGAVADTRGPARGWGRLVMVLYWVLAAATTGPALWLLIRQSEYPVGPRLVALLAGLVYVAAAIGITHNGTKMRRLAWTANITALVGPVVVGLWELGSSPTPRTLSAWSNFGVDYFYLPLVVPIIGILWLWASEPRRIVEMAENRELA